MSTYRGYMPWKSSLSGYSPKSDSGSRYSSRDDVASVESKTTPRFGNLTSPTSYRPSYSGGTYRSVKRDLPAVTPASSYTSKYNTIGSPSKDSPDSKDYLSTKKVNASKYGSAKTLSPEAKPSRYTGSTTSLNSKTKIREPSPVVERRSTLNISSIRSRDPSPATYGNKSRDPSPAEPRFYGTTSTGYSSSGYNRLYSRANTGSYGTKYGSRSAGTALSYLTASDASARCTSQRAKRDKTSRDCTKENSKEPDSSRDDSLSTSIDESSFSTDTTSATQDCEKMIEVSVITRGTSPNPPSSSTSYIRTRRIDNAKTIEKTIKRPMNKPITEDKEIQSDRMDDSTKYSRFTTSRITPWSYVDNNKFNASGYSRFGNSTTNGSSSKVNSPKSEKERSDTDSEKKSPSKSSHSASISRSSSVKSNSKTKSSSDSRSSVESKSKSSVKQSSPSSKSKSPESRTLPPQPPKSESPSKTVSSSTGSFKWTNKDFRKSALNVGQSDRPRKSRTASVESDQENGVEKVILTTSRRSPSAGSEVSSCTSTTITSTSEDDSKQTSKLTSSSLPPSVCNGDDLPKNILRTELCRTAPSHLQQNDLSQNDTSSSKNDETKSFLIRALGPVTNLFKSKSAQPQSVQLNRPDTIYVDDNNSTSISENISQDTESVFPATKTKSNIQTDDPNWWTNDTNSNNNPGDFGSNMKYKLRHIDSGEIAWWMTENDNDDNDDTIADDITLNQDETSERTEPITGKFKIRHVESGEKAWWLTNDVSEETNGGITSEEVVNFGNEKENSPVKQKYQIAHIQSGERAWWLNDDNEVDKPTQNTNNGKMCTIRHIESGEKAWWMNGDDSNDSTSYNQPNTKSISSNRATSDDCRWWTNQDKSNDSSKTKSPIKTDTRTEYKIRHIESGEKAWWMTDENNDDAADEVDNLNVNAMKNCSLECDKSPLGDRASPEGLEDTTKDRSSPYDHLSNGSGKVKNLKKLFISKHTNIDEILGSSCHPLSPVLLLDEFASKDFQEISPAQVRIHDSTAQMPVIHRMQHDRDSWDYLSSPASYTTNKLDDAALQIYKEGDYGAYLDLESSLAEQAEDIEGLHSSRKNSLVVRTQLSVRVHAIIDKLLTSEGRDLRRALFSLKQIFQEDKDLVHGFVALGGLNCLVRVGSGADQNYQNYILRALGQVMLYVDGMNGVMKHGPTIQWLYTLIASKYRLVVKTALKLLLVFVEYVESNCYLLVNGIHAVDGARGSLPWSNVMRLLKDYDNADTELLIYATSLINKTLSGLSDQDSFYDESDYLEQQGMEGVVQRYMSRPGTDLDLLDQLQLYEAVLKFEDGESEGIRIPDNSVRKTLRYRASNGTQNETHERRKSRRHSTGNSPMPPPIPPHPKSYTVPAQQIVDEDSSSSANSGELNDVFGIAKGNRDGAGVTPGLRRRRERAERQKTFMREQQEAAASGVRPFEERPEENGHESENEDKKLLLQLKRDHTVKDLTQKLSNLPMSPQEEKPNRIGDMSGLISKAKEGLAKSKSKGDISRSPSVDQEIKKHEPKKSENELHWEELVKSMSRPLRLCDLDFTDLQIEDDVDDLAPRSLNGGPPPPPPMGMSGIMMPPPMMNFPPPPVNHMAPMHNSHSQNDQNGDVNGTIKKNKKTVKLFWKEVRDDMLPFSAGKTIWDELPETNIDVEKLEHLFESRAKDLMTKEKQQELNKNKEIIVLDHKRSNAINIAMTKLPPPRAIKAAILKMDATVVTREGIDKLLNMLPTDEERGKIQEAQVLNPELPLGSAEQFLLTLSSISELAARLKLWAFKLDFENSEKEIAEPLMDLKQGLESLRNNRTFKFILSTLRSIGIFLNGTPVKGFQIEYLAKVPEVKDTVHKHSLLHHLCHMVMESSMDTTDLYSEIGPITRASKTDFADLAHNISYLEAECKASWDRLKLIAKHDCPPQLKQKMVDFLADCAERIIILDIVHRRVINRYRKFLLWLGVPQLRILESRPNEVCRIISEFALEYRTTRERVHQQMEKKANHRERNKTRGKMIIDVAKFRTQEDRADCELRQLLGSPNSSVEAAESPNIFTSLRRHRPSNIRSPLLRHTDENFTDGDDDILESLVKTATKAAGPRPTPRERKRTRHADRKSLRRTLKNGLSEEERQHVAAYIKGY
ncbi:FH1/FH2 domain-containing protein 3 isoform X3 [Bradysia coprophila]|uniref:FH1/FH2 domain-containing protein 3 isoform X3 n=1 Tax=Bradysia coprophila TaxID=38358 RepID=UPI00187DD6B9|nr:FH1/FH2 domain-containing protein 3 isoform X3 [Bradysia coprophila]